MGLKLLSITAASLIMLGFIDVFVRWYGHFLQRRIPEARTRQLFLKLVWAILACLFWANLYFRGMPQTFEFSYFLFVVFIYSVRGLIASFLKTER